MEASAAAAAVLRLLTVLAAFTTLVAGHVPSELVVPLSELTASFPCGDNYTGTKGIIMSPNYPNNYPPNIDCQWTVTSPENTIITVHFDSFYTESGRDYLDIRDGNDTNAQLLKQCYGGSCSGVSSTGNTIFIYFHTDGYNEYKGFYLNWFAGFGYESCYYCDNYPESNHYDPACGKDNYGGIVDGSDKCLTCYTNIHYDGSHRVERGCAESLEEDGTCYDSGFSITCYCKGNECNNDLCQQCTIPITTTQPFITSTPPPTTTNTHPSITTMQPSITSTQPPATTTLPPSSSHPSTPSGPLQCYSCIGCNNIDGDTNIESSEEFLSCSTAIELGNTHFVIRGGSRDNHGDGVCYETDGVFVCYCTSDLCNGEPAAQFYQ